MDFFDMLNYVSNFVPGVKWFLGIPFNQTQPFRLDVVKYGEQVLGDKLLGFQAANGMCFVIHLKEFANIRTIRA